MIKTNMKKIINKQKIKSFYIVFIKNVEEILSGLKTELAYTFKPSNIFFSLYFNTKKRSELLKHNFLYKNSYKIVNDEIIWENRKWNKKAN